MSLERGVEGPMIPLDRLLFMDIINISINYSNQPVLIPWKCARYSADTPGLAEVVSIELVKAPDVARS